MLREARNNGAGIAVEWRPFPLEQVNAEEEGWLLWEQPEEDTRGLAAFRASLAARAQGDEPWERLHDALFEARHADKYRLERTTIRRVATEQGLDADRLLAEMDAPELDRELAASYEGAVKRGVFGVPTLFFGPEHGAYLRVMPASTGADAVRELDAIRHVVAGMPNVDEIKRPSA